MANRRTFIKNIGLLGLTAPFINPAALLNPTRKLPALGIQLYMVKEDMEKETRGTLKKLGEMGYTQIESYGGNRGMFWGMGNKEFQKLANGYGLTLVSSHYNDEPGGFEQQAEKAAEIGMKYLICPWKGPQKSIDNLNVSPMSLTGTVKSVKNMICGLATIRMIIPIRRSMVNCR